MAIVLFQVAALVARTRLELELAGSRIDAALVKNLAYLVVPPVLLVLMFPYLARCRDALAALLDPRRLTVRLALAAVALGLTLRILRWAVLTLLTWLGMAGHNQGPAGALLVAFECPPPGVLLPGFVVMVMVTPCMEEIVNRGFILHALLPRGRRLALTTSAALFAAMHPPSTYALTFAAGLVFAMQALNFRTLWAPLIAHATYNAAAIVDWECFRIVWNPPPGDPLLGKLAIISAMVTPAGILAVCWLASNRAAGGSSPVCRRAAPATERSPPFR